VEKLSYIRASGLVKVDGVFQPWSSSKLIAVRTLQQHLKTEGCLMTKPESAIAKHTSTSRMILGTICSEHMETKHTAFDLMMMIRNLFSAHGSRTCIQ
jgi:hypothetical protein